MIYEITDIEKTEEMTKSEYELYNVLEKHDKELKDKMLDYITHSYFNAMMEVDRRKLTERSGTDRPRIEYYLKSMFYYLFSKLHKGDKVRAYEILEEIKDKVVKI